MANIKITNLTSFPVGFLRINGGGEVNIPPNTEIVVDKDEVISQYQSGNKLFRGENFDINHAYIRIEDAETRKYLGIDTDEKKQETLDADKVKKIFAIKSLAEFKKTVKEIAVTTSEKKTLVAIIKSLEINDHSKIKAVEDITGIPVDAE